MHPLNFSASKSCCCEERGPSRRLPRRKISGPHGKSKTRAYVFVLLLFIACGLVFKVFSSLRIPAEPVPGSLGCWTEDLNKMAGAYPCSDTALSMPTYSAQVALMFLVRDQIPTEPIWSAFIAAAAELSLQHPVPPTAPSDPTFLPSSRAATGDSPKCRGRYLPPVREVEPAVGEPTPPITNTTEWIQKNLNTQLTPRQLYEKQDLFSIYVHSKPGFIFRHPDSIFFGRDIKDRVRAAVSQPSLVEAHRNLLKAALSNPRNSMFLLVSEVCVPLHHPALLWAQLMAEAHISRVDGKSEDMQRFQAVMGFGAFRRRNFQKSSQWVSLTRMHATLVAYDDHVWPRFDNFCRTGIDCGPGRNFRDRVCVADEHYVPTLLSVYRQNHARSSNSGLTYSFFPPLSHHPRTFPPGSLHAALQDMKCRNWIGWRSEYDIALASSAGLFHNTSASFLKSAEPQTGLDSQAEADVFDPMSTRTDHTLTADTVTLLHNLWQSADKGSRAARLSTDISDSSEDAAGAVGLSLKSSTENATNKHVHSVVQHAALKQDARHLPDSTTVVDQTGVLDSASTGSNRHLLQKEETQGKLAMIQAAMTSNLRQSKWLKGFEPLSMSCPLLGRRVHPDAVSEWAAAAWDCDGLGFSWKCLQSAP